jgi:hypothetical protein
MESESDWETITSSSVSSRSSSAASSLPSVLYDDIEDNFYDDATSLARTPVVKRTKEMLATNELVVFDADCVRKRSNWSSAKREYNLLEYPENDPKQLLDAMWANSPKLAVLLKHIRALDEKDQRDHKKQFKHMIFTDLKSSGYGVKAIASALLASGFHSGYTAKLTENGKYEKLHFVDNSPPNKTFMVLSSVAIFGQPLSVTMKKSILAKFNDRPENAYGKQVRFIIMDSGFKEGIDLFDLKYVHVFEPSATLADQKQVIGRGTRTCGQMGLQFHPTQGWPLNVYIYDAVIPKELRSLLGNAKTVFQLYLKALNLDLRLFAFAGELENATILGSVDNELNANIHDFSVDNGTVVGGSVSKELAMLDAIRLNELRQPKLDYEELKRHIRINYNKYKWSKAKMENLCGQSDKPFELTPTQNFLKRYFVPANPLKGMLLWHSTGSGKTCSAIAVASNEFERQGYTILWVTRTTLKNDIWKNMFGQVCHEIIRAKLSANEIAIPSEQPKRMKLLSQSWRIRPMSYKQFSNLVSKRNAIYDTLVKINGPADPLRKTLIIIDESHKLYGGGSDLSSIERPDMDALYASLQNSYIVSGQESVRLLLMTATPITTNPMELIKLLNLCRQKPMPTDFDDFVSEYLEPQTGKFSADGLTRYMNDIAGHVSYLNREKDARQFAQPIIHQIRIPLTKISDIALYDKRATRELASSGILELKASIEATNEELQGELGDLDVNKFKVLKKVCVGHPEIKKKCEQIAAKNMRDLAKEASKEVKAMKERIKAVREQIRAQTMFKKSQLAEIAKKIESDPKLFAKYKEGAFYSIKSKCGSVIRTESDLLKQHPELQSYAVALEAHDEKLRQMEAMLKMSETGYKNKIDELKAMAKQADLNDLERSTVKLVLKDTQKEARKSKRANEKTAQNERTQMNTTRKSIVKSRKRRVGSLKSELKEQLRDEKMETTEIRKATKHLNKMKRLQDDYDETIGHGLLKDLVAKYTEKTESDVAIEKQKDSDKRTRKMQEKSDKKTRKAQEKSDKMMEKEKAKADKKSQKEQEKADKKSQKELEKADKKSQKELEKADKKSQKELEKADKKTRKAQEMADKKANRATRKLKSK